MTVDTQDLEKDCQLAVRLQSAIEWSTWLGVLRIAGYEAFDSLQATSLGNHMDAHFLDGLAKLGVPDDAPDAVKCALYHSLSNDLGGNKMSHLIESSDKAWIFYHAPYNNNPLMGVSYMVIRPSTWIMQMEAWHAKDGLALGNGRLAFVATHFISLGHPYDAGYFIDTGRELHDQERFQIRIGEEPPANVQMEWPRYDDATWPPARRWKAHRNYARGFGSGALATVASRLPHEQAAEIIDYALRTVYFATVDDVLEALNLPARVPLTGEQLAAYIAHAEAVTGTRVEVTDDGGDPGLFLSEPSWFSAREWAELDQAPRWLVAAAVERALNALGQHLTNGYGVVVSDGGRRIRIKGTEAASPALGGSWPRAELMRVL